MRDVIRGWVDALDLKPHPEGGYYRETYRAETNVPTTFGDRSASTAIYFLVPSNSFSSLHRIASDEVWHFHAGGALEIVVINEAGERRDLHLGLDLAAGERPQHVVKGGDWFGARLRRPEDGYALVSCTVAPGFDFADFVMAKRASLLRFFPQHADIVTALTRC